MITQGLYDSLGLSRTRPAIRRRWKAEVISGSITVNDHNAILGTGIREFLVGRTTSGDLGNAEFWWKPIQAHNGIIEVYINLGIVGLTILTSVLLVTFGKCYRDLLHECEMGR
jgi:hypothetical protein